MFFIKVIWNPHYIAVALQCNFYSGSKQSNETQMSSIYEQKWQILNQSAHSFSTLSNHRRPHSWHALTSGGKLTHRLMTLAATRRCSESRYAEGSSIKYTSAGWKTKVSKNELKQLSSLSTNVTNVMSDECLRDDTNYRHTFPRQIVSATRCSSPPDKFWTWKKTKPDQQSILTEWLQIK